MLFSHEGAEFKSLGFLLFVFNFYLVSPVGPDSAILDAISE